MNSLIDRQEDDFGLKSVCPYCEVFKKKSSMANKFAVRTDIIKRFSSIVRY